MSEELGQPTKTKRSPDETARFLTEALHRFNISAQAEADMRKEALECDHFSIGNQWPGDVSNSRGLDGRPCLTINKTEPAIMQVTNDMRQNRPQGHVIPETDATEAEADILEGMARHIQVAGHADVAIDVAFDNQVRGGWGYFRIATKYCNENSFDQEVCILPIKNRFTVYPDPFATIPVYADARWYFIVSDMPKSEFRRDYPKASTSNGMLSSTGDDLTKGWIAEETVRVAEYWYIDEEFSKLYLLEDGKTMYKKEYDRLEKAAREANAANPDMGAITIPQIKRERDVTIRQVKCAKMTAYEILDEYEWLGKWIPIIPVLGKDHEIEGKRYLRGITYNMMDAQRQYNYWTSAATEAIALAPKAPWLIAEGQVESYEQIWQNANRGTPSYLPYKPQILSGQLLPPPVRITAEPPIQAMAMSISQASQNLKETSGIYDSSLGAMGNETSGKAILMRQKQSDIANFNFSDNGARSIKFATEMIVDLIPKIYDTARVVEILGMDGTLASKQINGHLLPEDQQALNQIYDVTKGTYGVVMISGPSYNTKRQQSAESMLGVTQAYPQLWSLAGDLIAKNFDWPGAQELAKRLHKALPPQLQEPEDGSTPIPPKVQQALAQSQEMIQALTQQLNVALDEKAMKTAELSSKEMIAAMDNQTKLVISAMTSEINNNMNVFKEELKHLQLQMSMAQAKEIAAEQPAPVSGAQNAPT